MKAHVYAVAYDHHQQLPEMCPSPRASEGRTRNQRRNGENRMLACHQRIQ